MFTYRTHSPACPLSTCSSPSSPLAGANRCINDSGSSVTKIQKPAFCLSAFGCSFLPKETLLKKMVYQEIIQTYANLRWHSISQTSFNFSFKTKSKLKYAKHHINRRTESNEKNIRKFVIPDVASIRHI